MFLLETILSSCEYNILYNMLCFMHMIITSSFFYVISIIHVFSFLSFKKVLKTIDNQYFKSKNI